MQEADGHAIPSKHQIEQKEPDDKVDFRHEKLGKVQSKVGILPAEQVMIQLIYSYTVVYLDLIIMMHLVNQ